MPMTTPLTPTHFSSCTTNYITCVASDSQVTAQKNQWELDKLQTQSEMLKKFAVDEVDSHSKEGAYIVGLSMQGARWDPNSVSIEKSKARNGLEVFPLGSSDSTAVPNC